VASSEIGPIWRSTRRHRAFALLIVEVALGFFIIGNLLMTSRWYAAHALPPSGHREADVVEVMSRGPAAADAAGRRQAELAALRAIPGVRFAVGVSSSELDDCWGTPDVFWTDAHVPVAPSACADVTRSADGVVVGWPVSAGPGLVEALDLSYVEREAPGVAAPTGVLVTRCLRDALTGGASALGLTLRSNRYPPARIVGVIDDVRLHVAFLYQTHVTAIYPGTPDDPRVARTLLRTEPGRAEAVRDAVRPALAGLSAGADGDRLLVARLVSGADTRSAGVARGTVLLLIYVGGLLGVLAVLGNFAVAAFLVGDRRRIIGVRRALGASRWDILRYLLIENLLPTQLGNLLGFLVLLATLPAAKLRFAGIRFDVIDVLATALLLSLGGILAKLLPALRATRIPPSEVTRSL
jgi:putative ABC transport system permease protein